jgi:hypothetical protein
LAISEAGSWLTCEVRSKKNNLPVLERASRNRFDLFIGNGTQRRA